MRGVFSKRERLKYGRERIMGERSEHVVVERKIARKKYTHRIETYRRKDGKDVEKSEMKNSKAVKRGMIGKKNDREEEKRLYENKLYSGRLKNEAQ